MTKDEALRMALDTLISYRTAIKKYGYAFERGEVAITAIKEALAEQAKQEPVAYLCENAVGHKYFRWKKPSSTYKPVALYTAPPKREWVGLTVEQIEDVGFNLLPTVPQKDFVAFARAIEAAHGIKETQ